MKDKIHPKYHKQAVVHCSCGNTFKVGATKPEIKVEVCGACHPFYTGKEKMLDTAGRVDKFKKRVERAQAMKSTGSKKRKKKS